MIEAAQAGKHIFCEKPIALDLPSIDRALAEVEKNGVKLQVGFNRRFHAAFKHIHNLVASDHAPQHHSLHSRRWAHAVAFLVLFGAIF